MSGPICPECSTLALIETKEHYSCPICGWSGADPPRKIIDAETSQVLGQRTRMLLALRLDNQLRYVRVELVGDEDARSDTVLEVTDFLDLENVQGDRLIRFFVKGDNVNLINEIKNIPGVKTVSVF